MAEDLTTLPGLTDRRREIMQGHIEESGLCRLCDCQWPCHVAELLRDLSAAAVDRATLADVDSKVIALLEKERDRERARAEAAERERDAAVRKVEILRLFRFNETTGCMSGGNRHPDRCQCQGSDPTPHKHYADAPYSCARCGHENCSAYKPHVPYSTAARTRRIAVLEELPAIAEKFAARVHERCPNWFEEERGSTDFSDADHKLRAALAKVRESKETTK